MSNPANCEESLYSFVLYPSPHYFITYSYFLSEKPLNLFHILYEAYFISRTSGEKERMVCVHDKHLLTGIKALCRGSGALHRADQSSLTAAMKAAKLPPHIKTVAPGTSPPAGLLLLGIGASDTF